MKNDFWYVEWNGEIWLEFVYLGGNFSIDGIDSGVMEYDGMVYFYVDWEGIGLNVVDIYSFKCF